jgi:hypothetical protein
MKTCVRKLFYNFNGDPMDGSKVRALLNRYRFRIYSKENSVLKLFYNFEVDPTVGSKVRALSMRYSGLERRDLRLIE